MSSAAWFDLGIITALMALLVLAYWTTLPTNPPPHTPRPHRLRALLRRTR